MIKMLKLINGELIIGENIKGNTFKDVVAVIITSQGATLIPYMSGIKPSYEFKFPKDQILMVVKTDDIADDLIKFYKKFFNKDIIIDPKDIIVQ